VTATCSRGKIKSLQDASATAVRHATLLLDDVAAVCSRKTDGSADDVRDKAQALRQVGVHCAAWGRWVQQI